MSSLLFLQGGADFQPPCEPMDRSVLAMVQPTRVVVTALAGSPGRDYATASANGVRWWRSLGCDAVTAPDARADEPAALAVLASADLVVLPGGSPSRLRAALLDTGVGALIVERWHAGECAVVGASAGAMLACSHTFLPDQPGRPVASGLGMLPAALVVPHWSGESSWLSGIDGKLPEGIRIVGLPECSGVLVEGSRWTALGAEPAELVGHRLLPLGVQVEVAAP